MTRKHPEQTINITDLEECEISIYRSSQYSSFLEASEDRGVKTFETTYGYTPTMDGIINCCELANLMEYGSHRDDIKAVITVNGGFQLGEVFLDEAPERIDAFLVYLTSHPENPNEKEFQNFLNFYRD